MSQDMDNMVGSCVFYLKVGTCTYLEQGKNSLLTAIKTGIVWLTVQHKVIISVSFMYYTRDSFRQTSAAILSLEQWPIDS